MVKKLVVEKMVNLTTPDGKVLGTKDIVKHLIFNIGEDIEGNFYPNHMDFYICFGTCHTEKGGLYIAILVTILFIFDTIFATITQMWYFLPFIAIILPIECLLIYGIKKDKEKLILPHLMLSILITFIGFIVLIFVCIAFVSPKFFFYKMIMAMFMESDYESVQLVCLLYALIIFITMSLLFWVNWSLYIHYRFIKGLKVSAKKSSQATVI